jgi:hypothetical protein
VVAGCAVGILSHLVSRAVVLYIVTAILVLSVVGGFIYLHAADEGAATTTTTTTSTTTTTTTTTTTLPPTTTSSTTTSSTTSTSSTTTTTTEPAPLFSRDLYKVLVVNGSTQGERLTPTIDLLHLAGYEDVRGAAGAVLTTETSIYMLGEPLRSAADRLADDIGLSHDRVFLFSDGPLIAARADAQLILYLGGG